MVVKWDQRLLPEPIERNSLGDPFFFDLVHSAIGNGGRKRIPKKISGWGNTSLYVSLFVSFIFYEK